MKFTAYFLTLTAAQRNEINKNGWSSPVGKAYLAITLPSDGKDLEPAVEHDLYAKAAVLEARDVETAWVMLQNLNAGWKETAGVECFTDFPRSMSVGDIFYSENGWEFCATFGFEPVTNLKLIEYLKTK